MRRFLSRRPSPAMVVAFVALSVALAGTAGALPGKHSVKRDDLATGSVGKRAIRRNAVGGSELIENRVTGAQVNESTLGVVPRAGNAASADAARAAGTAGNAGLLDGLDSTAFVRVRRRVFQASVAAVNDYGGGVPLASVSGLPAGQYVAFAKLSVHNDTAQGPLGGPSDPETIDCLLNVPGPGDDLSEAIIGARTLPASTVPYTLQAAFNAPSGSSVTVTCEQSGADNDALNVRLMAVRQN